MNKIKSAYNNIIGTNLYYFSLIILVIALPLSPFMTSTAQMWLGLNYILEGQFKRKWQIIKSDSILHLFLIIPVVMIVWLMNTSDFAFALYDMKIKVPLLLLPVIIRSSEKLSTKKINTILWFFTWALFSGSLISMAVNLGIFPRDIDDIRQISIFISHIRFSLMIVFSICFLLWKLWNNRSNTPLIYKALYVGLIIWFFVFISILRSLTSWIILLLLFYILFFIYNKHIKATAIKYIGFALVVLLPLLVFSYVFKVYKDYSTIKPINFSELPSHTPRGNKYRNDTLKKHTECGNYIYILLSRKELREGWPLISDIPIKQKTKSGYTIEHRVIRYLTSLGLPKDLDGLAKLDKKDIQLIENGFASSIHKTKSSIYIKIYESIYDLDIFLKYGNPNDKSISMRYEFLKVGFHIIKNNFWIGVGTGDSVAMYNETYEATDSLLNKDNRHRAHNQFVLFLISFGLIGFLFCILSVLGPLFFTKEKTFLLISFCTILFLSMLNEDTLETQAGVTFYILFYSLLVTHNKQLNQ